MKEHIFKIRTEWTGNAGSGTSDYASYSRNHTISAKGKSQPIQGSSHPLFKGDASFYNPEDLFISSLSACHMLWYLHLCADHGIIVDAYEDQATGVMEVAADGTGKFRQVILFPRVTVRNEDMIEKATSLHHEANAHCYIANSCNFPVLHEPIVTIKN